MDSSKQEQHDAAPSGKRHDIVHSAFSTMLFENFGNKGLAKVLIQYPMSCQTQLSALQAFAETWSKYLTSEEYKKARAKSHQAKTPGHVRPSSKIWLAKQKIKQAQQLSDQVQKYGNIWFSFSQKEKDLLEQYKHGSLQAVLYTAIEDRAIRAIEETLAAKEP
jgi:hypothetical protein